MNTQGPGAVVAAPVMASLYGRTDTMDRTCSVDGCERSLYGNGLCEAHAKRLRDHGDVMAAVPVGRSRRPQEPVETRFWANVDATGDCWEWRGTVTRHGYGIVALPRAGGKTTKIMAHRFAWQVLVDDVPAGLELDHRCRHKLCVNPAHLEPVTHEVNTLRSYGPSASNARKSACPKGHEYVLMGAGRGCVPCQRQGQRERRAAA